MRRLANSNHVQYVIDALQNAQKAIQTEDERSRQQCRCEWEYATGIGTRRVNNPLCPVHDLERVVKTVAQQCDLAVLKA
ncbi:MAG: hypothetical protein ACR2JB_13585 [Bryobacteraceae bacterium]